MWRWASRPIIWTISTSLAEQGDGARPGSGCAVLLSDGPGGSKPMCVGAQFAGRTFVDLLGNCPGEVVLDESGSAAFFVNGGSVSVWGPKPE